MPTEANAPILGIIGGTGALGGAIARAVLASRWVAPAQLWLANRSGTPSGFEPAAGITFTSDASAVIASSDIVVLSVPPDRVADLPLRAPETLVVSVVAGLGLDRLADMTGSDRVVRAMSSPAAATGLAYSPWVAGPGVSAVDRALVTALFEACGQTDEVTNEAQIEVFTALTGPVPGFVAFYAAAMIDFARARGVDPDIADKAVRQLFLSAGRILSEESSPAADHVDAMITYAGTTAAGLTVLRDGPSGTALAEALDAAVARVRTIGQDDG
ncbi:MAG: pyrroline-5-carboxylate reductase dimerization domain-containing protein [Pseudomonadota bacterium]